MKFSGDATLKAAPEQVWAALHDPGALARTLPGCESLTTTGPHAYAMRVTAGVAAIKGTYDGTVAMSEQQPPSSLVMKVDGAGGPGTVAATVDVRLAPADGGGTTLTYDADAIVGGPMGGVGQRMLAGVTRKMAGQFFTALDNDISGVLTPEAIVAAASGGGTAAAPGEAAVGQVFSGRGDSTRSANASAAFNVDGGAAFALGALLGGALALTGVIIGARLGRRDA